MSNPIKPEHLCEIAHRTASRYRHGDAWPYQFGDYGLGNFAARLYAEFQKLQSAAPAGQESYIQTVPDHCDRIVWRGNYHALPLAAGMALVPVKPTPEIRDALRIGSRRDVPGDPLCDIRYAAMLVAAGVKP